MILRHLLAGQQNPVTSGSLDTEVTGLAYDSRLVGPGVAFFALRGAIADGHRFINQAIAAGAAAIIAEQAPPLDCPLPWVHVRHSRIALALAAAVFHHHPANDLRIAAVTGTNGKTTTAFLLHHLLNAGQLRAGLLGTLFYDLGLEIVPATHTTPESLELQQLFAKMRENGCRSCAMEVSSHALDQERVAGVPFETAIFTNLTQDHLDYHETMPNYFEAKAKLFAAVATHGKGHMIINLDDDWGRKLIKRYQDTGLVTTFGHGVQADLRATNVRSSFTGTTFELDVKGRSFLVKSPLIGDFNVQNAMAALAAAYAMRLNLRETVRCLASAPQVPGRLERVTDSHPFHIFVDYAHTPDALKNVLETLRQLRPERLITVFGCGGDRDRTKRPKMAAAAGEGSDICILTSDNPRTEDPQQILSDAANGFPRGTRHTIIEHRRQAIHTAIRHARRGDIVLIAGKGHEDYQDIQGVKQPFDDRDVARQMLARLRDERLSEDPGPE